MTTTIRLSGPADVLTVLPYQLGFHPHRCLVAVSLRGSRSTRMGLVQRIDLPPPDCVADAVAAMLPPLQQDRPESVLLIGFEECQGESRAMLDELARACQACGLVVSERLVVRGGRWFSLDCSSRICCPSEGWLLPAPSSVPAVAEFVGRGISPLPNRSALVALLEPDRATLSEAVSRLANEWSQLRREAIEQGATGPSIQQRRISRRRGIQKGSDQQGECNAERERSTPESGLDGFRVSELAVWSIVLCGRDDAEPVRALPPQDLAMLAVSLTDVDLRDGLIARLCPGTLPSELIDPTLFAQMSQALPELSGLREPAGGECGAVQHSGDGRSDGEHARRECGGDECGGDECGGDECGGDTCGGDTCGGDGNAGDMARVIGEQRIERRLCELSAALPDTWAVATLTLLASFSWWRGDGALTRVALDRALRVDPQYRLAQLLERMVDLGIRPQQASL